MRKILYSYLLKEQGLAVLICLLGVTFVLITGQLLQLMRILFASSCSIRDVVEVVLFTMPKLLLYGAPMAALLGTMLAFVRLNGDNELIAFRAAGTGFLEFLPPVLGLLVFFTVLAFINAVYVIPVSNGAFELKLRSLGRSSIPSLLKEGTFISTIPKLVLFFRSVDHTELSIKGVFLQDQRQPKEKVTIAAESAQIEIPPDSSNITFRMENGVITRIADNLKDAQSISFKNYDFTLSMDEVMGAAEKGPKKKREMSLRELLNEIKSAKDLKGLAYFSLEMNQRLAFPSACLLLGLLGPPLGSLFRQRSRMTGVTVGVGIFLLYYILLSAGKGLGENGLISPFFAVWTPNLLSLVLVVYLWTKMHRETSFSFRGAERLVGWLRRLALPGKGGGAREMRIIPRYVLRHFLPVFALSILAFLGLYLVVDFFERVDRMMEFHLPAQDIYAYFLFKIPLILTQGIPMAAILSTIISLGLLKKNRELIAMETAGVNPVYYVAPIAMAAVVLSFLHFGIEEFAVRPLNQKLDDIWEVRLNHQKKSSASLTQENMWYRRENTIYQIRLYDQPRKVMEKASIFYVDSQFHLVERVDARRISWTEAGWLAEDGLIMRFNGPNTEQQWFDSKQLDLNVSPRDFTAGETVPDNLGWLDLYRYIERLEQEGFTATPYEVDLQMRLASPLATFILALLGIVVATRQGLHGGIASGVGISLALAFAFLAVSSAGSSLASAGRLSPFFGVWVGHIIFSAFVFYSWVTRNG